MIKMILEQKGYFTNLASKVDCQDKGKRGGKCEYCRKGNWFICDLCDRKVPYCFGGGHEDPVHSEYCDSCYVEAINFQPA